MTVVTHAVFPNQGEMQRVVRGREMATVSTRTYVIFGIADCLPERPYTSRDFERLLTQKHDGIVEAKPRYAHRPSLKGPLMVLEKVIVEYYVGVSLDELDALVLELCRNYLGQPDLPLYGPGVVFGLPVEAIGAGLPGDQLEERETEPVQQNMPAMV